MLRPVALVTSTVRVLTLAVAMLVLLGSPRSALAGPFLLIAPPPAPAVQPQAGRGMVAVVKSPDADGPCQEIVTRIVAELMADGVSVVALTCPTAAPACVAGSGARVSAIVLVQVRDNVRAVEVHAAEPSQPGYLVPARATVPAARVRRLAEAQTGGGPAALAVRTVEVLRAMLVEGAGAELPPGSVAARDSSAAATVRARPASPPASPADAEVSAEPSRALVAVGPANITLGAGAAMFAGFDGLNPAFGPALTIGRRAADHVMLSLALAGPGFGRDQSNAAGTVSVRHEMAALQADLLGLFLRRFVLRVGVGAGLYHVSIDGSPPPGAVSVTPMGIRADPMLGVGRSAGAFSGLLSWSAGVVTNLRPHLGIFVDARMLVLTPTPVVSLNGLEVGRVGNPQISLSAGLEFRL